MRAPATAGCITKGHTPEKQRRALRDDVATCTLETALLGWSGRRSESAGRVTITPQLQHRVRGITHTEQVGQRLCAGLMLVFGVSCVCFGALGLYRLGALCGDVRLGSRNDLAVYITSLGL